MAFHQARHAKERMDDEERRAIADADDAALAASQAESSGSDNSAE